MRQSFATAHFKARRATGATESLIRGLSFAESYAFFDAWVIMALRRLGLEAWYAPLNDITASGGKIGGAAQARRWNAVLHHVTMAYDMNGDLLELMARIVTRRVDHLDRGTFAHAAYSWSRWAIPRCWCARGFRACRSPGWRSNVAAAECSC